MSVGIPVFIICLLPFVCRILKNGADAKPRDAEIIDWFSLAGYIFVGVVVAVWMLVLTLDTPSSFMQVFDNGFHLNVTRAFVDSGSWSILDASKYMTPVDQEVDPLGGGHGSFYPAAWHIICSLVFSLVGGSLTSVVNSVNFVIAGVVFPASMMLLFRTVFDSRRIVLIGAVCTPAFVSFPWALLIWGPLYPNVFACALVPAACALFVMIVDSIIKGELAQHANIVFLFAIACVSLVISQPNAVFLSVVLLTPYCVFRIWTIEKDPVLLGLNVSRKVLAIVFAIFVVCVWTAAVFAPFMRNTVFIENWTASLGKKQALLSIILLSFQQYSPQIAGASAVLIGFVHSLRHREHLWAIVPFLVLCLAFVLCTSTESFAKHYLAGFWYTDPYRISACLAISGIPLAALGLHATVEFLRKRLARHRGAYFACIASLLVVFFLVSVAPSKIINGIAIETAFGEARDELVLSNSSALRNIYDVNEVAFVDEVKELIPNDAIVANIPDDGSAFAYGVNDLHVLYRDFRTYADGALLEVGGGQPNESAASQTIRKAAAQVATNPYVHAAFDELGVEYVLVLDYGDSLDSQRVMGTYDKSLWTGLMAIKDSTPGYEIVLSRDDMRLYKLAG